MASMVAPSTTAPRRVVRGRDTDPPEHFDISERDRRSLSQRPSTSRPTTPNFSKRRVTSERVSRDDLFINSKSARSGAKHKSEIPSPSPPLSTPKSLPIKPRKGSFSPFPSISPSTAKMTPEPYIGMALGSPTHQPSNFSPPNTGAWTSSPDSVIIVEQWPTPDSHLRRKQSKWKTLGGLLGSRRHTEYVPTAFYQLQPEPTQDTSQTYTSTVEAVPDPFPEEPPEVPEKPPKMVKVKRSSSLKSKVEKAKLEKKPSLKRAHTASQIADRAEADEVSQVMTDRGPPDFDEDERFDVQTPIVSPVAPQLDVDIPSIKLDRYSVMFSGLLGKSGSTSSALLARRQANLEKLKTVNEAIQEEQEVNQKEQEARSRLTTKPRPASSPQSPSFSLFPAPLRAGFSSESPLHRRAATSPAAISPLRPSFAPGPAYGGPGVLQSLPSAMGIKSPTQRVSKIKPSRESYADPSPVALDTFHPNTSLLILDSPEDDKPSPAATPPPEAMKRKVAPQIQNSKVKAQVAETPAWQPRSSSYAPKDAGLGSITSGVSTSEVSSSTSTWSNAPWSTAPTVPMTVTTIKAEARENPKASPKGSHTHTQSHTAYATSPVVSPRTRSATVSTSSPSNAGPKAPRMTSLESKEKEREQRDREQRERETAEEVERRLKNAAARSIARQISMSQQQRQLLLPMHVAANSSSSLKSSLAQSQGPMGKVNGSPKEKEREQQREKEREREREKEQEQEQEREREKERERQRQREKEREREKEVQREREREKQKQKEKEKEQEQEKAQEREKEKEQEQARERERVRLREREKAKEKGRQRDREQERTRELEKERLKAQQQQQQQQQLPPSLMIGNKERKGSSSGARPSGSGSNASTPTTTPIDGPKAAAPTTSPATATSGGVSTGLKGVRAEKEREREREKQRQREKERRREKELQDAEDRILAGGTVKRGLSILQEHGGHRYQRSQAGVLEGMTSPR